MEHEQNKMKLLKVMKNVGTLIAYEQIEEGQVHSKCSRRNAEKKHFRYTVRT